MIQALPFISDPREERSKTVKFKSLKVSSIAVRINWNKLKLSSCRLCNYINDIRKRNPYFVFFFRLMEFTSSLQITLMLKEINVRLFTLSTDFLELSDVRFAWINGFNIVARFGNNTCWQRIFNGNFWWLFILVTDFFGCISSVVLGRCC